MKIRQACKQLGYTKGQIKRIYCYADFQPDVIRAHYFHLVDGIDYPMRSYPNSWLNIYWRITKWLRKEYVKQYGVADL